MRPFRLLAATLAFSALGAAAAPEVSLRWNRVGYTPDRPKSLVAMSRTDLAGQRWTIHRADATAARPVREGEFGPSVVGVGDHTPLPFNHTADFGSLTEPGRYRFVFADVPPAEFRIAAAPYAELLALPLQHLRLMRSGPDVAAPRKPSHPGDAHAPVFVPDGDPALGKWRAAEPARTVDASSGWYDAGDQIKFTLNIAYTTYHLLFAYHLAPDLHGRPAPEQPLPPLLAEAQHGLAFLLRTFPDRDTFILQIGDERDHEQPERLPENDPLDGRRPALCALSRTHMAGAAAALALGARIFRDLGFTSEAERYAALARALHARTLDADTLATAFERGKVNDFYLDPTEVDQRALAAAELFALTGERTYLNQAVALAPPPGTEVSWGEWNWLANLALAPHDAGARDRLLAETSRYARHAATAGRPWSVPGRYVWGSLHRWVGAANAARLASPLAGAAADHDAFFLAMLDYTFGRNNWGVSFVFAEGLPGGVRHIYSPAYRLLRLFPTGALSEGPGDRATHEVMARLFAATPPDPLARFDTAAAVFRDNGDDFMCQESTIGGQADLVLLLTLASLPAPAAR
ncbi:MAG TPA: glycoside hydrolase family 9 protein [Opitutaceae bacterium]|nr:glycoside hydrolase family 9 protein [Opitutaceae bacterium]